MRRPASSDGKATQLSSCSAVAPEYPVHGAENFPASDLSSAYSVLPLLSEVHGCGLHLPQEYRLSATKRPAKQRQPKCKTRTPNSDRIPTTFSLAWRSSGTSPCEAFACPCWSMPGDLWRPDAPQVSVAGMDGGFPAQDRPRSPAVGGHTHRHRHSCTRLQKCRSSVPF